MNMKNTTPMTTPFEQIKTESKTRSQRIGTILKDAFTQTSTEVKEGYTIMRPLAAELSDTVMADLKQKRHQASSTFKAAWDDTADQTSTWERWQRVLKAVATALKKALTPPLQKQAARVDDQLTDQYGDTYQSMKRGLQSLKHWYVNATDPEEMTESSTQPLTVAPPEGRTVDVVASSVESTVQ